MRYFVLLILFQLAATCQGSQPPKGSPLNEWEKKMLEAAAEGDSITLAFVLDQHKNFININAVDANGLTALWYVTTIEPATDVLPTRIDAVQALLKLAANPNIADPETGATPLMNAAAIGDLAVIKLLLDNGANINAQDKSGFTPVSYSVQKRKWKARDYLKSRGGKTKAELESSTLELLSSRLTRLQNRLERLLQRLEAIKK